MHKETEDFIEMDESLDHHQRGDSAEYRFAHEKEQQGWPDDMDEEIWNEHFRFED